MVIAVPQNFAIMALFSQTIWHQTSRKSWAVSLAIKKYFQILNYVTFQGNQCLELEIMTTQKAIRTWYNLK